MDDESTLDGRKVLVVEDDYMIAELLAEALRAYGMEVIGPAASVEKALALISATPGIDVALVDVNLRGTMSFPVADALRTRGVALAFTTGYDDDNLPERYAQVARFQKPVNPVEVVAGLLA